MSGITRDSNLDATEASALFTIAAGEPTPEEFAALSVVLHGVVNELTATQDGDGNLRQNAWQRSQRPMRRTIKRGYDSWRSFSV